MSCKIACARGSITVMASVTPRRSLVLDGLFAHPLLALAAALLPAAHTALAALLPVLAFLPPRARPRRQLRLDDRGGGDQVDAGLEAEAGHALLAGRGHRRPQHPQHQH